MVEHDDFGDMHMITKTSGLLYWDTTERRISRVQTSYVPTRGAPGMLTPDRTHSLYQVRNSHFHRKRTWRWAYTGRHGGSEIGRESLP